jgi:ketosteroid isomerase-like protein
MCLLPPAIANALSTTPYPNGQLERVFMNEEAAIKRMLDETAIQRTTAQFADAATLGDYDSFRATWADDAVWTIGDPPRVTAIGIEDIVAMLRKLREPKDFFVQFALPGIIEVKGDTATARGLGHEAARASGDVFYRNHYMVFDRLHRVSDNWVFTSRTFKYIWLDTGPFGGQSFTVAQ